MLFKQGTEQERKSYSGSKNPEQGTGIMNWKVPQANCCALWPVLVGGLAMLCSCRGLFSSRWMLREMMLLRW